MFALFNPRIRMDNTRQPLSLPVNIGLFEAHLKVAHGVYEHMNVLGGCDQPRNGIKASAAGDDVGRRRKVADELVRYVAGKACVSSDDDGSFLEPFQSVAYFAAKARNCSVNGRRIVNRQVTS